MGRYGPRSKLLLAVALITLVSVGWPNLDITIFYTLFAGNSILEALTWDLMNMYFNFLWKALAVMIMFPSPPTQRRMAIVFSLLAALIRVGLALPNKVGSVYGTLSHSIYLPGVLVSVIVGSCWEFVGFPLALAFYLGRFHPVAKPTRCRAMEALMAVWITAWFGLLLCFQLLDLSGNLYAYWALMSGPIWGFLVLAAAVTLVDMHGTKKHGRTIARAPGYLVMYLWVVAMMPQMGGSVLFAFSSNGTGYYFLMTVVFHIVFQVIRRLIPYGYKWASLDESGGPALLFPVQFAQQFFSCIFFQFSDPWASTGNMVSFVLLLLFQGLCIIVSDTDIGTRALLWFRGRYMQNTLLAVEPSSIDSKLKGIQTRILQAGQSLLADILVCFSISSTYYITAIFLGVLQTELVVDFFNYCLFHIEEERYGASFGKEMGERFGVILLARSIFHILSLMYLKLRLKRLSRALAVVSTAEDVSAMQLADQARPGLRENKTHRIDVQPHHDTTEALHLLPLADSSPVPISVAAMCARYISIEKAVFFILVAISLQRTGFTIANNMSNALPCINTPTTAATTSTGIVVSSVYIPQSPQMAGQNTAVQNQTATQATSTVAAVILPHAALPAGQVPSQVPPSNTTMQLPYANGTYRATTVSSAQSSTASASPLTPSTASASQTETGASTLAQYASQQSSGTGSATTVTTATTATATSSGSGATPCSTHSVCPVAAYQQILEQPLQHSVGNGHRRRLQKRDTEFYYVFSIQPDPGVYWIWTVQNLLSS
ncbi:uncharacterized protein BJ171DRAFT_628137 [Polychytrium aggregatum]|uniref:uncharacterized protein n=1 Tax=Polychytrium aggregatum TaxID=110093 RepID=UPI0022FE545F|nr:uncharacterized protein BJ171DRAFT_628137 [Polychytrium aggregatum]KAI9202277.1 hypothetical protein BJ171DRAFT_628137 [Polychytrium aggregatum]